MKSRWIKPKVEIATKFNKFYYPTSNIDVIDFRSKDDPSIFNLSCKFGFREKLNIDGLYTMLELTLENKQKEDLIKKRRISISKPKKSFNDLVRLYLFAIAARFLEMLHMQPKFYHPVFQKDKDRILFKKRENVSQFIYTRAADGTIISRPKKLNLDTRQIKY